MNFLKSRGFYNSKIDVDQLVQEIKMSWDSLIEIP